MFFTCLVYIYPLPVLVALCIIMFSLSVPSNIKSFESHWNGVRDRWGGGGIVGDTTLLSFSGENPVMGQLNTPV